MQIDRLRKPVPAEAVELVDHHGPDAVLVARMHLVQAQEAGDEPRVIHWQTLLDAIAAITDERRNQPGHPDRKDMEPS